MSATTLVLALAVFVVLLVAGASLTLAARAHSISKTVRTAWETSKPAKIGAEVEGLREELLAHKRVVRAELGRIWQRMPRGATEPRHVIDADDGGNAPHATNGAMDPELEAELALQRAPAASPGTRG